MRNKQLPEEHYYLGNGQEIPNPRTETMSDINHYLKQASKLIDANNDDSDIKWAGQVMTKAKQLKHADLKVQNTQVLDASGIKYKKASEEAYLFREENKPKVDFYPSTGRWRVPGERKTYRGGAKSFIKWYGKK